MKASQPGIALYTDDAEDADDEDVASLADAISRKVVREAMTGRPIPPGTQQMPPTLLSPHSPAAPPRPRECPASTRSGNQRAAAAP